MDTHIVDTIYNLMKARAGEIGKIVAKRDALETRPHKFFCI